VDAFVWVVISGVAPDAIVSGVVAIEKSVVVTVVVSVSVVAPAPSEVWSVTPEPVIAPTEGRIGVVPRIKTTKEPTIVVIIPRGIPTGSSPIDAYAYDVAAVIIIVVRIQFAV
jgi:hypothetical protein